MEDWHSYDAIAENYDRICSARFETVARHIWARVPLNVGDAVLDIGTGTGIVLRVRSELARKAKLAIGCDRSGRNASTGPRRGGGCPFPCGQRHCPAISRGELPYCASELHPVARPGLHDLPFGDASGYEVRWNRRGVELGAAFRPL
jgi:SAM-dependent methyltransferase